MELSEIKRNLEEYQNHLNVDLGLLNEILLKMLLIQKFYIIMVRYISYAHSL